MLWRAQKIWPALTLAAALATTGCAASQPLISAASRQASTPTACPAARATELRATYQRPHPVFLRVGNALTVRFPASSVNYWHSPRLTNPVPVALDHAMACKQGALLLTVKARRPGQSTLSVLSEPRDSTVRPDPGPGFQWLLRIRVMRR